MQTRSWPELGVSPLVCVDAGSLGPEGSMIGYKTKKKRTNKKKTSKRIGGTLCESKPCGGGELLGNTLEKDKIVIFLSIFWSI